MRWRHKLRSWTWATKLPCTCCQPPRSRGASTELPAKFGRSFLEKVKVLIDRLIRKAQEKYNRVTKGSVMSIDQKLWMRPWLSLGAQPPTGLFSEIVAAYGQPQRHYHSQQHLSECLAHFDQVGHLAEHPGEVEIALWFHDAIYDVHGKDSEQQSADWAVRILAASGIGQPTLEHVESLIMATKHAAIPARPDEQLLTDIDLAILGAKPQRFAEYSEQVRAEYSWVPHFEYITKRKSILTAFLARPYIYSTNFFRERYEAQARANLESVVCGPS